ncbi:class I SAM-dependent methyltransferase [Marinibacterium profundimaris]|uniref:ATP synthase subunit beta n=1 Tax=Marinibacterium profundimaris TaxID=1679460 RepID=A0A225ND88_9RHOB|nr:SAM-dependent methyltransferase [Marinibacterium profundimaris]OWU67873.1 ATP synthase subunit beta [Marinibacterium profundimaris]
MSLTDHLVARIRTEGPLSIADYMGDCLLHPTMGYYTTRDPLGAAGDFTTAPEISQMFGEMLGLCLAQCWLDQGQPDRFVLAELGPGRGTLMADVLRATRAVPGFRDAAQVVLVEASPTLRKAQAERLAGEDSAWRDQVADLPEGPLYLLANEFFDALPIRQFVRDGSGWRERRVGLEGEALAFGLGPAGPQPALAHRLEDTAEGDLVEICPALPGIAAEIGRRIETHGGAALIVDYGGWRSLGDTLQALRAHQKTDPLETPGSADLTAHVDFEAIARATPSRATAMTTQGVFLERLGITARAQALARGMDETTLDAHVAAHRRLTHPDEMGNLFQVLGLHPARANPPAGLYP